MQPRLHNIKRQERATARQAVIKVFEDKISTDEKELMELTAGFAAGMGSLESTCGALIGAVMTAGVLTEGKGTPRFSREILPEIFRKKRSYHLQGTQRR